MRERERCVVCGERKLLQNMIDDESGPSCRKHFSMEELQNAEARLLERELGYLKEALERTKKEMAMTNAVLDVYKKEKENHAETTPTYLTNRLGHEADAMARVLLGPATTANERRAAIIQMASMCLVVLDKWGRQAEVTQ